MSEASRPTTDAADSDRACLLGVARGQRRGLEVLLERYETRIANAVYQIVGDWDAALDVTQEAFLRILRRAQTFRPDGNARAWIFAIALNLAKDHLRRRRRIVFLDRITDESGLRPGGSDDHRDRLERQETQRRVQEVLASLPDSVRTLIVLRDFEELSYEDLCALYECELGTIKSRLHRARRQFEERFRREARAES